MYRQNNQSLFNRYSISIYSKPDSEQLLLGRLDKRIFRDFDAFFNLRDIGTNTLRRIRLATNLENG